MDASITETATPVPLENIVLWEHTAFSNFDGLVSSAVLVQFTSTLSHTEIVHDTATKQHNGLLSGSVLPCPTLKSYMRQSDTNTVVCCLVQLWSCPRLNSYMRQPDTNTMVSGTSSIQTNIHTVCHS